MYFFSTTQSDVTYLFLKNYLSNMCCEMVELFETDNHEHGCLDDLWAGTLDCECMRLIEEESVPHLNHLWNCRRHEDRPDIGVPLFW